MQKLYVGIYGTTGDLCLGVNLSIFFSVLSNDVGRYCHL